MKGAALPFVLAGRPGRVEPSASMLKADAAKKAARFWIGTEAYALRKDQCIERLTRALGDGKRVAEVLAGLPADQRAVLAVVRRFGGSISGALLGYELLARGIVKESRREGYHRRQADPVERLRERLLLSTLPGYHGYYDDYYSPWSPRGYADVALPAQVAPVIEPAASLDWKPSRPPPKAPDSRSSRAPAQMMVDLEQMIGALKELDGWKVNKGGALPVAGRNRLGRLLSASAGDPLEPPDRIALEYALLCGLGVVEFDDGDGWLQPERAERLLHLPHEAQASEWVRAWLTMRFWQDGIGQVPDRDGREEMLRIDPGALRKARALLAWALTRVAHGPGDWLDLETFLLDLYDITGEGGRSFYWHRYVWRPHLAGVAGKDKLPSGRERSRAFWLDDVGVWAANVLLSTLVHLGVVERGRSGPAASERWCFRLTECGRAVFGAPEIQSRKPSGEEKCLTVQPNHEILLYLDAADGPAVTTLGRIASRQTTTGIVQTFRLTRESVYGALEEGMTPAAIESFLTRHSRSGLPENLSRSLAEWSRKREALVVRSGVAVGANLGSGHDGLHGSAVGARFVVSSARALSERAKELGIAAEPVPPVPDWKIDEHGVISPGGPQSLIGGARLRRFAVFSEGAWRITPESTRAARDRGIPGQQILGWLKAHLSHEVPALLTTAIENWAGVAGKSFLGELVVLQVNDPQACEALRASTRLRPFVKGMLGLDCFVVAAEKRNQVRKLMEELGFALEGPCDLKALEARGGPVRDQAKAVVRLGRRRR